MNDRDDEKIVSLDQRRRAEQARQKAAVKAEIAAAARRKRSNGSGEGFHRSFGEPLRARPAKPAGGFAHGLGSLLAWVIWAGLAASVALAIWGWMAKG